MLLKSLEMQGFKSFPDKTKVEFGKGLTAVVGPNGSGKSNISDAVRWVMGEQSTKTLRGNKMEDVIFAGTKSRKSQGFAEVSLSIDNSDRQLNIDSDIVTVTRRYDRSGESEYMINRSNVRLKDLQEIFMDTGLGKDGYSLVGQGKIAEIVQTKSTERREIFEEAAGISKFRYRRNEAERNLEKAEENLLRLRDILSELEVRIEPLKEQSEKAKKFLSLSEEKKLLEVSIWIASIERTNMLLKDQGDKLLACEMSKNEIEEKINQVEEEIQLSFTNMQNCLVRSDELRREKDGLEKGIGEIAAQLAVGENNVKHNNDNIARLRGEIESQTENQSFAEREISDKKGIIEALFKEIDEIKQVAASKQDELLKHNENSESSTQEERTLSDRVNGLLLKQSEQKMRLAAAQAGLNEIEETANSSGEQLSQKENELNEYAKELSAEQRFLTELSKKLESLNNTYSGYKLRLENRKEKAEKTKAEWEKLNLSLNEKEQKIKLLTSMEQAMDGFASSVREVLTFSGRGVLKGIHGTVSQIIEAENEYATAIETALGGSMQNIVTENEADAKAAIRLLKQESLGRATFLPLTSVSGYELNVQGLDRYAGFVGVASDLVKYDKKYSPVVLSLLGRIAVVEDLDTAVMIAQKNGYKFRIVTLDGQMVNAGGSLTGGSKNKGQSFLSRKNEISALQAEATALREKSAQSEKQYKDYAADVAKCEAEYVAAASEITTVNEDIIRVNGEIKRLEQLKTQLEQSVSVFKGEIEIRTARKKLLEKEIAEHTNSVDELSREIEAKNEELKSIEAKNADFAKAKAEIADEISGLKIKIAEKQKDIEIENASIAEIEKRQSELGSQKVSIEQSIEQLIKDNEKLAEDAVKLSSLTAENRAKIAEIEKEVAVLIDSRNQHEGKATALRKSEHELTDQREKLASEAARLGEKKNQIEREYDEVITNLYTEYELTKTEAQAIAKPIEDYRRASSELNSLKGKIKALGSVNVDAIEEYREVSERFTFLSGQIQDAQKAKDELNKLIGELTDKMYEIFEERFKLINENFQRIFVELFGGGRADLKLTNPENLLESGIEIFVEPPGKVIKNLTLLSGGEQAFVAIAIYFAILKVRPSPFCILDEIEAALDDVNVDKYAAYLRSLCDNTQFIMITHRRGSMEAADMLYGVTMQDEGVSKLLQLNVSDVSSENIKL